jgi:hypothetical protein
VSAELIGETDMARGALKPRTVAVKVEEELADFLDRLPNKSEFIRQAILAQFGMACPLCAGSGQVPAAVGSHYAPVLAAHRRRACSRCAAEEPIPADPGAAGEGDRGRWEQFFHGGPLLCRRCYAAALACGECGWHLTANQLADHVRHAHRD